MDAHPSCRTCLVSRMSYVWYIRGVCFIDAGYMRRMDALPSCRTCVMSNIHKLNLTHTEWVERFDADLHERVAYKLCLIHMSHLSYIPNELKGWMRMFCVVYELCLIWVVSYMSCVWYIQAMPQRMNGRNACRCFMSHFNYVGYLLCRILIRHDTYIQNEWTRWMLVFHVTHELCLIHIRHVSYIQNEWER